MSNFAATPIRVSIPYKAANNLGTYKDAIRNALADLGCPACCSGHDIYFDTEKHFKLSSDLKVQPLRDVAFAPAVANRPAHTLLAEGAVSKDIDLVFKSIDAMADISGCPACCSGLDLFFSNRFDQVQLSTFRNGL